MRQAETDDAIDRELGEALEDTLEVIVREASSARFDHITVPVRVLESAKVVWRERYRTLYREAIATKQRTWAADKGQVLERAREVGLTAALLATIVSLLQEVSHAGIGQRPGQDITVEPARQPKIDGAIAEAAAGCIDCQKLRPHWDWCTRASLLTFKGLVALLVPSLIDSARNGQTVAATLENVAQSRTQTGRASAKKKRKK